jgi:GNAT superfamily N-acetyltransferase
VGMDTRASMNIVELSADDSGHVEGIAELRNAIGEHEAPWMIPSTPHQVASWMRHGWDLEPGRYFGRFVDDRLVALGQVSTSEWDNLDLAWLGCSVHPDARKQGHGRAMADHVEAVALEMGRTKLGADAFDGSSGVRFTERRGYTLGSTAVNRRQHLEEVSLENIKNLYDEATAAASTYELVRIVGRTPEELLDDVAVMSAAINDAPLDDLDIEDEVYPPQRIRDYETAIERRGERLYRLLVRHRESGELAGHTVVAVEGEQPEIGHQHDTSVVRSHRGHRLGLLLKSGMNLWLADTEPQLRTVDTWNAESNDHMIAVNEALGYRPVAREHQFQKTVRPSSGPVA